ncbi:MAG: SEL1-like repeat protein [Alphaproteobacteria bacterium]|nr:SEL1-like repeat protein [Alphaproteobacteria bacterium]
MIFFSALRLFICFSIFLFLQAEAATVGYVYPDQLASIPEDQITQQHRRKFLIQFEEKLGALKSIVTDGQSVSIFLSHAWHVEALTPNERSQFSLLNEAKYYDQLCWEIYNTLTLAGFNVIFDREEEQIRSQGTEGFMANNINEADVVLSVCTSTYQRRSTEKRSDGTPTGVKKEVDLIKDRLISRPNHRHFFLPLLVNYEAVTDMNDVKNWLSAVVPGFTPAWNDKFLHRDRYVTSMLSVFADLYSTKSRQLGKGEYAANMKRAYVSKLEEMKMVPDKFDANNGTVIDNKELSHIRDNIFTNLHNRAKINIKYNKEDSVYNCNFNILKMFIMAIIAAAACKTYVPYVPGFIKNQFPFRSPGIRPNVLDTTMVDNQETSQPFKQNFNKPFTANSIISDAPDTSPINTIPKDFFNINPDLKALFDKAYNNYKSGKDAEAFKIFKELAENHKHAGSQYYIGMMHLEGRGTNKNEKEGVHFLELARDQKYADAEYNLGLIYRDGIYHKQNLKKTCELFQKAADQGHINAQSNLGVMYGNGDGCKKDAKEAFKWFQKSAAQGDARAQYNLGIVYENGIDCEKDLVLAVIWYRKAAAQGYSTAQCNLGIMYENGAGGLPKDLVLAVEWYGRAANQGEARAQCNLGVMYENGAEGLAKDPVQAIMWYKKAAGQGDANGQCSLGFMYENGAGGLAKDPVKARELYEKAAKQGYARAQYNLGVMYENGTGGLPKDLAKAKELYEKAAKQEQRDALKALQRLGKYRAL